jgi:hypothetical protein
LKKEKIFKTGLLAQGLFSKKNIPGPDPDNLGILSIVFEEEKKTRTNLLVFLDALWP